MAVLIPDIPKTCPRSERIVYENLGRDLPDDWVILHSLGLPGHATKFWGEADIVILSTRGIFALEVKGGKVECRDGVWHFGEPGRNGYSKKEDPWTQAMGTMVAIKKKLKEADSSFGDLLFGFGVVMPMEEFTATGAEIIPDVLLDRRNFQDNMMDYIKRLEQFWSAHWRAKHNRKYDMPTAKQVRRARILLRPDIKSTYSLGGYLTGVDRQLLQLTNAQIKAARRMSANPRTIVRGSAGTGKTVLATERARELSAGGNRVLLLTFNHLLARHIREGLAVDPRARTVEVHHVHGLYRRVILEAGMIASLEAAENSEDFFSEVFPRLFIDALIETDLPSWDALVVDEAQDLLTPNHLDAFDLLLKDGLQRGRWHLFLDPLQNIYGDTVQNPASARLSECFPAYDDLWENCRNTKEVATQTSIISGLDHAIEGAPDGLACDNIYYSSQNDFERKLEKTVRSLLEGGVSPSDIIVLSTRKKPNSLVSNLTSVAGLPLYDIGVGPAPKKNTLHFSTMHSFKGLERGVVLAIDMVEVGAQQWSMLHYTGLSRAKGILRAFLPNSRQKNYKDQARAFGLRLGSSRIFS